MGISGGGGLLNKRMYDQEKGVDKQTKKGDLMGYRLNASIYEGKHINFRLYSYCFSTCNYVYKKLTTEYTVLISC